MDRRLPVYEATDRRLIASGLAPDLHPLHLPLWAEAQGVSFYRGKVRRTRGRALAFDEGAASVRGLLQLQASNGVRWIWAGAGSSIYRWFAGNAELIGAMPTFQTDQTLIAMATQYDLVNFGDWVIINNGVDTPQIYKGAGLVTFGNAPVAAQFIKKANFMMALGAGANGKTVAWSDADAIETWTQLDTNLAGELVLEDIDSRIIGGEKLGPYIACYGEDQMGLISFIGEPYYFAGRLALDGIGLVGKKAVCSTGRMNYGVSWNGIWVTDGQSFRYIHELQLFDYLEQNVNWDQRSKIVAARNDVLGTIDFHFPMGANTENSEGWRFDPRSEGWSKIPAASAQIERSTFPYGIIGQSSGDVSFLDFSNTPDEALVLRTKPLSSAPRDSMYVDEIDILATIATEIEFRVGVSENTDYPTRWTEWQDVHTDTSTHRFRNAITGTFITVEFRSKAAGWDLDLQGFILYGRFEGERRDRN